MSKDYYIYIMTNFNETAFYVGFTNNLLRRINEHKEKFIEGHTNKYNITKLVYYEITSSLEEAKLREKKLKNWHREWKINLVKKSNPEFKDLYDEIIQ